MTKEKTKNMYLKTVFFPPKILKGITFQINAGYFPNAADLVRYAVRKFLYEVMDFSFWPPKIKVGLEFIEDIPGKHEKERRTRAYELMKTHGIKSANRKLREEYGMGVSEQMLRLFDEEIRNNLKLENKKNIGLVKEINHLAKEKLNPTPEIKIEPDKIKSPKLKETEIVLDPKKESKPKKKKKYEMVWDLAIKGKSVDQIAKIMGLTEQTVYQHLSYNKKIKKLKKCPFALKKKKRKKKEKKKKEPLGNIYHPKPETHKKVDVNSLFDEKGNLLVNTRIISKKTSEAVK